MRLAAQNVGRRRLRAIFLGIAVMLGVGVAFATFIAGWSLRAGIATSFSRMGADLLVVPRGTLVNITSSLLTVQPTDETLDVSVAASLAAIAGVARVAPQRIVPSLVDGRPVDLIAFDPAHDFSVVAWLEEHQLGPVSADGLIAGGSVAGRLGERLSVCGRPLSVYGRLGKTGVGPFDDAYFLSFEALADVVAFCRSSRVQRSANAVGPQSAASAIAGIDHHSDGATCAADLPLGRVSAFLLQLSPGARIDDVKFAIAQLPDVRVVEGNSVLTSSRQAMSSLLIGVAVFAVFQLTALLIVVSLLFSAIVQERYREVGLLRAMGARPSQVMAIILAEAAIITGLGGLAGLVFGATLLLIFARSLGFYFGLLHIPFSWPPFAIFEMGAAASITFSAMLGLVGAFVPAWRARQVAPHTLIQAEAR
jgi:putative ABC transport system permease protein